MRFVLTGEPKFNGEDTKNPYIRVGKSNSGNEYKSFNCSLKAAKNNTVYAELFGMKQDVIKTMDTNNNKIDVNWEDRKDAEVIDTTANYKKNVISIGDDRYEFISPYDAIECLVDNIEELKVGKITITGQISKNVYNGKITDRFQIQNVYTVNEDIKSQFKCNDIYYFNKESFDTADWKAEKKITINGWISTYISDVKANKFVSHPIVFDCSKIDFDNEDHRKKVNFKLKMIGCELTDDNKIKINLKNNKYYSMAVVLNYQNGAEEAEFDESMLSPMQKESIELGLKTIDDFKSNVWGERVSVYKLVDYDMREISGNDYSNGYIETDYKAEEFEDEIFVASKKTETLAEAVKNSSKNDDKPPFEEADDDDEDLFS